MGARLGISGEAPKAATVGARSGGGQALSRPEQNCVQNTSERPCPVTMEDSNLSANRQTTGKRMPQRKNSRSFQPGQSGNPLGRPVLTPQQKAQELELVQACRERS